MKRFVITFILTVMLTTAGQAQLLITQLDSPFTMDFNDFRGTGFTSAPASDQLDSDTWSITGLSDGDLSFGGTAITGDLARGTSRGGVSTGGVYAFEVAAGDYALGGQPMASDLNPGAVILQCRNATGFSIVEVNLTYDICIFNDSEGAMEILLSYSNDGGVYYEKPATGCSSPLQSGVPSEWNHYNRSITLTGVDWPAESHFYLKFIVENEEGTGEYDEFAIDNISLTARSVSSANLVINEIHADPDASEGDANSDGVISSSHDEFLELVNAGTENLDLSGFTVSDKTAVRYTFPVGTMLAPGAALVIFGGGAPSGEFGASQVHISSLSLNNSGDMVTIASPPGVAIASVSYGSAGGDNQSLAREPDLTGDFTKHSEITGAGGKRYSPGTLSDGARFPGNPDAGSSRYIEGDGPVDFGSGTGVDILMSGSMNTGPVSAGRYANGPESANGISEQNVSTYRWIITNPGGIYFSESTELRFRLSEIPGHGIHDGDQVSVYSRNFPGIGEFTSCQATFAPLAGEIVVSGLTGFSEFVFASNDQSLPVSISSFTGEVRNDGVKIRWITESEQDNLGFLIERKTWNESAFQKLSDYRIDENLEGAGSTAERQVYTFLDRSAEQDSTYDYRLSSISYEGVADIYDRILTVTVREKASGPEYTYSLSEAYPNPFNPTTTISYTLPDRQQVTIDLYALDGRKLNTLYRGHSTMGPHTLFISLPDYPSGLYLLQMETPDYRETKKLMLLK